jgi:exodeoxyribonuclease-1
MKPPATFLWHDYETFGAQPMYDRPAQFAAQRTDADLQPLGEPVSFFCAPADDVLPHPAACLITGITPQRARSEGVVETEFAGRILAEMSQPGTCSAGYNSIRFDDVFTRNLLYRNFRDPYEREYQNGNSRWDLIDLARMCYALRPDGIQWPMRADGETQTAAPSFKLEDLARANAIEHGEAHEALADVRATIALARLLKDRQPRLFDWALGLRDQKAAMALLDPVDGKPVVHTSGRIAAIRGCTTLVLPIAILPDRPKAVVVFDLMADPGPLIDQPVETIADLVFTPSADMPDGMERLPLKTVYSNHVPMLAPVATLHDTDTGRIGLDPSRCDRHARILLRALPQVRPKVIEVFARPHDEDNEAGGADPDQMLYSGGFFSPRDKQLMRSVLATPAAALASQDWKFTDPRLPLMLFRYRARNYPATLTNAEQEAWDRDRARRLVTPADSRQFGYEAFRRAVAELRVLHAQDGSKQRILDQLESWALHTGLERLWLEQQ